VSATEIASSLVFSGDLDEGFEWLERGYSKRDSELVHIRLYPGLDGVGTDPRYVYLLRTLGLKETLNRN